MNSLVFFAGAVLCLIAIAVTFLVVLREPRVAADRRRPFGQTTKTALGTVSESTVALLNKTIGGGPYSRSKLEEAGLKASPADFLIIVAAVAAVFALLGLLLGGPLAGLLLALVPPFGALAYLSFLTGRRRARFDMQLGDNIMLITGGLRAGHSILRSIDAAAQEATAPSSEEFSRVINEARIGRDLQEALTDTAYRMKNTDFEWIAQAIQINREVGGDLAEVLDHVGDTIRERSQIKAQVKALSAEGKLSAIILVALPFGIALMLYLVNPAYLGVLFTNLIGWIMLAVGTVMMIIGTLWLRKIVQIKF